MPTYVTIECSDELDAQLLRRRIELRNWFESWHTLRGTVKVIPPDTIVHYVLECAECQAQKTPSWKIISPSRAVRAAHILRHRELTGHSALILTDEGPR